MHKVLVTGAAGFIGSHLVDQLLEKGHSVVGIDNLACGRRSNLDSALAHSRFSFHEIDICDQQNLAPLFKGVDWVFHLAALADIVPSIQKPQAYFRANVTGTLSVLEASRLSSVRRFVYAASSSCYGIPDTYPTEETAEIKPQYPYALTKNLGERLVIHWHEVYQLPAVALRMFNVFGPRSRTSGTYGAVFGVFLAQKLAGKPYTVVGDGTQTRDFTYVSDVTRAFAAAAESNQEGEIFNVGSGNTYSVNRLVELLDGSVVYVPKRPGEPDCTFADISKIKQSLNWRPTVRFEDGVAMMLDHINDWKDAPVWNEASISEATKEWFEHLGHSSTVTTTSQP